MSAVPYLTMGILLGVSGYLADWAQEKKYLTTTQGFENLFTNYSSLRQSSFSLKFVDISTVQLFWRKQFS
jgi:hypothetical protein